MTRAIAGYTGSNVTITTGGTYTGGGTTGFSGGTTFALCLTDRSYEILRQWADTICDQYQQGIGTTLAANIEFEATYKDNGDPPATITDENVKLVMLIGNRTLTSIQFVESFKGTGNAKDAARYSFKGKSDGAFTFA